MTRPWSWSPAPIFRWICSQEALHHHQSSLHRGARSQAHRPASVCNGRALQAAQGCSFSCFFPSSLFPPIPFPSMKLFDILYIYIHSLSMSFLHCFTQSVRINWINRRCHPNQCLCQEFPGPIDRLLLEVIAKTPDSHCWCWVVDIGKSFRWWMGAQVAVNSLGESVASQPLQMLSLFNFSLLKRCQLPNISKKVWWYTSLPTSS